MEAIDSEITKLWMPPAVFARLELEFEDTLSSCKDISREAKETLKARLEKLEQTNDLPPINVPPS